ncbi:MAG: glycosyltransferase [bacterium]|nr:glycosyltransferase [bacterium]
MAENTSEISCFIPCYNEEKIIGKCLDTIVPFLNKSGYTFEVFVIDDASTDNSAKIIIDKSISDKRIKYIRYNTGPSKRENLARSFKEAKGNIVFFTDADLSADINIIPAFIDKIKNGTDIAIGSRYVKGADVKRKILRLFYSKIYNFFVKIYFSSDILDHQCGLKIFKKDVLLDLVTKMGYDPTFQRGWTWDTELLLRAKKEGLRTEELPLKWRYRKGHYLNPFKQIKSINYLLKLKKELK